MHPPTAQSVRRGVPLSEQVFCFLRPGSSHEVEAGVEKGGHELRATSPWKASHAFRLSMLEKEGVPDMLVLGRPPTHRAEEVDAVEAILLGEPYGGDRSEDSGYW